MAKFQIQTRRGFKYEIETDDESELEGLVGQIEADEEAEAQKGQPLPEGVTPSSVSAGGGRGFVNPELPTETPRMGGRRGGSRPEMKPYVAKGEAELLDQPMPAGQKTPESMSDPMLRPEFVESVRATIGKLPAEKRMAELQRMAGGKTVEARAAREVLRQAEYTNQRVTPEAEDTARTLGVKPGLGGLGGAGKKPVIPSVEPTIRDIDERRAPAEIAARRELAAGVADANLGVDAIAQRDQRLQAADTSGVRRVADVGVSAVGGAVSGFKMLADAAGANNRLSQMIGGIGDLVDQARSAASLQDDRRISDLMKASEDGGVGEQILSAAQAFAIKPAEFIAQGVGTSVPAILAALLPGVREGTIAALATGGTVGAAMGAGTIKGGIYEEVKRELVKAGHSEADAELRAQAAQAYTSDNAGQIALGAVLGGIASATGQEGVAINLIKRTLGKQVSKKAAEEVRGGLIGAALKGGAVEAAPEFLQGGQEQYAKNVALGGEGFDVPEMRGVVGQGALEAAAGFGSGALISGLDYRGGAGQQLADALAADIANTSVNQQAIDDQVRRALDPNSRQAGAMPAETNFTPPDSSTRSAGLTDIVIPIAEVPDVGVPDAAGGLAAGGGAGLGGQPVGGVADPGSVPAVDGRVGAAAAGAGAAGSAPQPVRDGAAGGVAPALTDPVARTSDADLLARIAQPAGPVAAQPGAGNGQGQKAEVLTPAATAVDKEAKKAADKALAGAQQKAQRADDMLRAAEALGEPDTIEIARRVQQRAQADLASAQQEANAYVPTAAELGTQAREASATQGEGQAQDQAAMQQGRDGRAGAAAELTTQIEQAANAAATSDLNDLPQPTEAQKKAGNYAKGHTTWNGMPITFENPKGSKRSGVDPDGESWSVTMPAHYGYIKRTEGADGDQVDIYMGDSPDSAKAFVVDQVDANTGKFDEHKVILGVNSIEEAQALYDAGFSDGKGPQRRSAVTEMGVDELKSWVADGVKSNPLSATAPAAPRAQAASADLLGPRRGLLDASLRAIERSRKKLFGENAKLTLATNPSSDELSAIAFAEANGVDIAIVENQDQSRAFIGSAVNGINVIVRGVDTDHVLAVAVHEGIHTLDEDVKAALISAIEPTLRNRSEFQRLYRYGSGASVRANMTPEELAAEDSKITEEMVAMLGQSEAKRPEFWTKLATKMGDTQFGKFARHVLGKLDSMMAKFLAAEKIQRDALTTDLPLVQNALAEAYAQQLKRRGLNKDADRALAKFLNEERVQYAQRAYHGTPHRGIKQFTTEKMGTGEGAQVYGWGMYFAGDEEIGEFYRKSLTEKDPTQAPRRFIRGVEQKPGTGGYLAARLMDSSTLAKARKDVASWIEDAKAWSEKRKADSSEQDLLRAWEVALDELNRAESKSDFTKKGAQGQLYEVDIPDDTDLLDRDAKLRDQSPAVRDAVVGLLSGERLQWKRERTEDGERLTSGRMRIEVRGMGAELFDGKTKVGGYPTSAAAQVAAQKRADPTAMSGADAYNALSKKLGGDKAASLALADAGVRGLKYRDANSRGPDGGKSNYVIFRDEDVAIAGVRYSQAATDALTMPDGDIARLAGKSITLDVDTGAGQATMTMPADRAVRDIQERMAAAKKLVECLK